jgi:hypothetical protein
LKSASNILSKLKAAVKYLDRPELIIFANQSSPQWANFNTDTVTKETVAIKTKFDFSQPGRYLNYLQRDVLWDETGPLKYGIKKERTFLKIN